MTQINNNSAHQVMTTKDIAFSNASMAGLDPTFLAMAMQIRDQSDTVNQQMEQINHIRDWNKAISNQLDKLRWLKSQIELHKGTNENMKVLDFAKAALPPEKYHQFKFTYDKFKPLQQAAAGQWKDLNNGMKRLGLGVQTAEEGRAKIEQYENRMNDIFASEFGGKFPAQAVSFKSVDGKIVAVEDKETNLLASDKNRNISTTQLDEQIKKLEEDQKEVQSEREMAIIKLNNDIGAKNRWVSWLANTQKSTHDALMSVINKL